MANFNDDTVSVVDTITNTAIASVVVGAFPQGIGINADGSRVYVSNVIDDNISIIDTTTNTVILTVPVGTNPAGLVVGPKATPTPTPDDDDDSHKGCFIAVAHGSILEPRTQILRDFRDHFMLTNRPGRYFVESYYKYSPFVAERIAKDKTTRAITETALLPVVGMSWIFLRLGVITTLTLIILLVCGSIFVFKFRNRLERRNNRIFKCDIHDR